MAVKDDAYWQERLDANRSSLWRSAKRLRLTGIQQSPSKRSSRDTRSEDGPHNSAGGTMLHIWLRFQVKAIPARHLLEHNGRPFRQRLRC